MVSLSPSVTPELRARSPEQVGHPSALVRSRAAGRLKRKNPRDVEAYAWRAVDERAFRHAEHQRNDTGDAGRHRLLRAPATSATGTAYTGASTASGAPVLSAAGNRRRGVLGDQRPSEIKLFVQLGARRAKDHQRRSAFPERVRPGLRQLRGHRVRGQMIRTSTEELQTRRISAEPSSCVALARGLTRDQSAEALRYRAAAEGLSLHAAALAVLTPEPTEVLAARPSRSAESPSRGHLSAVRSLAAVGATAAMEGVGSAPQRGRHGR